MDGLMIACLVAGTNLVTALVTAVGTRLWDRRRATAAATRQVQDAHSQMVLRLGAVERQLGLIGQAVLPISTAFQAILIQELTHYHTPVLDALLVKLGPPFNLTPDEEADVLRLLEERERDLGDQISDSERDAAHILPLIMKRAKIEAQALAGEPSQLRLVAVPVIPDPSDPARPKE